MGTIYSTALLLCYKTIILITIQVLTGGHNILYSKALLRGHETIILITIQVLTGGHDIHSICKPPYLKIILKFYFLLHHHY